MTADNADVGKLPIPDWGLTCPQCRYPLRGLPRHRCPECGTEFDIETLIHSWTRLREPRFTGRELPLPDFGLTCPDCEQPLTGASEHRCPACRREFDPAWWQPASNWFILDREICGPLPMPGVQALLAAEGVPYIPVGEQTLSEIWGGQSIMVARLRIPGEFFFEVLWLVRQALEDLHATRAAGSGADWQCPACGEQNPGNFSLCWNCERPRGSG